jgi:hypothetical protein
MDANEQQANQDEIERLFDSIETSLQKLKDENEAMEQIVKRLEALNV